MLDHDNDLYYTSLLICPFLADNKIIRFPLPRYSPDLAPCDFWLFLDIKLMMKGNRFDTVPEIKSAVKDNIQSYFRSW
jgi:hypothetical protein